MGRTPQKAEPLSPTAPPTAHIHQNSLDGSNFMMLSQGHPQGHLQGHAENQITGPQPVDVSTTDISCACTAADLSRGTFG